MTTCLHCDSSTKDIFQIGKPLPTSVALQVFNRLLSAGHFPFMYEEQPGVFVVSCIGQDNLVDQ